MEENRKRLTTLIGLPFCRAGFQIFPWSGNDIIDLQDKADDQGNSSGRNNLCAQEQVGSDTSWEATERQLRELGPFKLQYLKHF